MRKVPEGYTIKAKRVGLSNQFKFVVICPDETEIKVYKLRFADYCPPWRQTELSYRHGMRLAKKDARSHAEAEAHARANKTNTWVTVPPKPRKP